MPEMYWMREVLVHVTTLFKFDGSDETENTKK
jgi:hypothetical protein